MKTSNHLKILIIFLCTVFTTKGQEFYNLGLHAEVTQVQPMTGIVFWSDNDSDVNQLGNKIQLEFSYLLYSDIVEEEGVYNWSIVEDILNKASDRGHQVILRFRYTYPGVTRSSVPDYILNSSDYETQILSVEGASTFIPDWSSQELQRFTLDFFTAFATRYDNDPRLALLQVGFGSYAEYHLYDGPLDLGQTFPSKTFQTEFLQHMGNSFRTAQWGISIDAASSRYSPFSQNENLLDINFGLFDDSFLHENHSTNNSEYNRASWLFFGQNRFYNGIAGGELNYYSAYDQEHVLDLPNGPHGTSFEELSSLYQISYMIGNDQLNYQPADRIKSAGMHTGYHFEITGFATNGQVTEVSVLNKGIAPIYYDAYVAIGNSKATESLRGLLPGETKTFTINTAGISESLKITCERLVDQQEIQFDADLNEDTLSQNDFIKDIQFEVFPNPFSDYLSVNNATETLVNLSLYTLSGSRVFSKDVVSSKYTLNTKDLQSGIYILKLSSDLEERTQLFVKQ